MKIKRLGFDPPVSYTDVSGITRYWSGIAIGKRAEYKKLKAEAIAAISGDNDPLTPCIKALEVAGFERDWVVSADKTIIEPLLIGGIDEIGLTPSLIDSVEFPFRGSQKPSPDNQPKTEVPGIEKVERLDQIWLTTMRGDRLIIDPLPLESRRQLDIFNSVILDISSEVDIREAYDTIPDFQFSINGILELYGISTNCVNANQMVELLFMPGWLTGIEIPMTSYIGGDKVPDDEDPYMATLASMMMAFPKTPIPDHIDFLQSTPWVRVSSLLETVGRVNQEMRDEIDEASKRSAKGKRSKGKGDGKAKPKPKAWKNSEFEATKGLLGKLKDGTAEIKPMSKAQQIALGG